jgi:hypothetical protein
MTPCSPRTLALVSISASLISLGAFAYTVSLPYRLSEAQEQSLPVAGGVYVLGAAVALAAAIAISITRRLQHLEGYGLLETFSFILVVLILLLVFFETGYHSSSHRPSALRSPNYPAARNAGTASGLAIEPLWPGVREPGRSATPNV